MSARDRKLAERYAAKGRESASEAARRKEQERGFRNGSSGGDQMGVMRRLAGTPRDTSSRDRARAHQRSAIDGSGGESFADRDAPATTGWFRRR